MNADVIALCEWAKTFLQNRLGSGVEVTREYEVTYDLGTVEGQKCVVLPLGYLSESPVTRREDQFDMRFAVIFLERYTDPAEPTRAVPTSWVDERVLLVEEEIFNPLSDARVVHDPLEGSNQYQYWSQFGEVAIVYDYVKLSRHKVFWTELEFSFRKLKGG